jgi:hypothetical protein
VPNASVIAVHGWAWDEGAPNAGQAPVVVRVSVSGLSTPVTPITTLANISRPDLVVAGVAPNAEHGFQIQFDLSPNKIDGSYKVTAEFMAANGTMVELESSPR